VITCPECGASRQGTEGAIAHLAVAHRRARRGQPPIAPYDTWVAWRVTEGAAIVAERRTSLAR